jgi:hypothetical protein
VLPLFCPLTEGGTCPQNEPIFSGNNRLFPLTLESTDVREHVKNQYPSKHSIATFHSRKSFLRLDAGESISGPPVHVDRFRIMIYDIPRYRPLVLAQGIHARYNSLRRLVPCKLIYDQQSGGVWAGGAFCALINCNSVHATGSCNVEFICQPLDFRWYEIRLVAKMTYVL